MTRRDAPRTGGLFSSGGASAGNSASGTSLPPGPPATSAGSEGQSNAPITVSQLAVLVERALRDHVRAGLKVVGEISQFRERTHWYFDLKDEAALVSCVMFASGARRAGFVPEIGQRVVVTGRVDFYAKQGRTTFMVDRIEPIGEGALELAFRKLCDELRGLGWFAEERKRPLPFFPRRVAVLTSATGAALQDVLDTVLRRCPAVDIAPIDVRVQGDSAAQEVTRAVKAIGAAHKRLGIDVLLITRGGGSREDLWAFNDRALAEAIVQCPIPVVAAIGHETDTTIAELVADVRAATPTQAAMRIVPDGAAFVRQLSALGSRLSMNLARQVRHDRTRISEASLGLRAAMRAGVSDARERLDQLAVRLERHRPVAVYAHREAELRRVEARLREAITGRMDRERLAELDRRLTIGVQRSIEQKTERLRAAERALELVGPPSVMRRGFSLTLSASGKPIRSAQEVASGQTIRTLVADGAFDSIVTGDGAAPGHAPEPAHVQRIAAHAKQPHSRTKQRSDEQGPTLFGG